MSTQRQKKALARVLSRSVLSVRSEAERIAAMEAMDTGDTVTLLDRIKNAPLIPDRRVPADVIGLLVLALVGGVAVSFTVSTLGVRFYDLIYWGLLGLFGSHFTNQKKEM
jgi:hypothetical protein